MDKPKLIIIRGAPGHGKTTLANELACKNGFDFFEADMKLDELVKEKGEEIRVKFLDRLSATCWRRKMVKETLAEGKSVITAGLFTKLNDLWHDLKLAEMYEAEIEIIDRYKPEHRFKNTRGTSEEKVNQILEEFEPVPADSDGVFRLKSVKMLA